MVCPYEQAVVRLLVLFLICHGVSPSAHFYVDIGCFILIKKIVQFVVGALHCM
jgi:hypothetical protein